MTKESLIAVIVVIVIIVAALGIYFYRRPSAPQGPAQLSIISPHWEGILNEFINKFKSWYENQTGRPIEVTYETYGTSDCVKRIETWYQTNEQGNWDILWGGGVDPFLKLKDEGLLQAVTDQELINYVKNNMPADYHGIPMYDPEYYWFGTALSGFGIMYNKDRIQEKGLPVPQTWEDLTKPEAFDEVGSADPRHSGSTHMMYEIILQAYGWDKGWEIITKMGGNIRDFPEHSSTIPKLVANGELSYGLAIDFYAWGKIAEVGADRIGYVMPEGLTVINPDSIAILKNAPHYEEAQMFIKFVLSDDGQKLWMLPKGAPGGPKNYTLGRMSVIPRLYDEIPASERAVQVNPFEIASTLSYNATKGGTRWAILNDLIGALIIDKHDELREAWSAIIDAMNSGVSEDKINQAIAKLCEMPATEEQILEWANQWSDEAFQQQKITEWHNFADQKYSEVLEILGVGG
ncbi:MAG: extracellular solute-binding protein [Thermoplasmata archaeon]|nr:extracellular solute-binding protein [Thermoplasmata archaeon]